MWKNTTKNDSAIVCVIEKHDVSHSNDAEGRWEASLCLWYSLMVPGCPCPSAAP